MFYADSEKEPFVGIAAQIQVLLVVIGSCSIEPIDISCLVKQVFTVVAVKEFSIAEVEVHL